MDGYKPGDELTLAFEKVYENSQLPDNATDLMICDSLFSVFNQSTGAGSDYYGPSMSVGDVIQICIDHGEIRAYAVNRLGFEFLGTPELTYLQRPAKWGPKQP